MSGKYALIIGNTEYDDKSLNRLSAPAKDVEDLAHVLGNKDIGSFDEVKILLNEAKNNIELAIEDLFSDKKHDDLLVLYFSGHGLKDDHNRLYLAVKNTERLRLLSTAVQSRFIRDVMDNSRAKQRVLILDCCHSGAFVGAKAGTEVGVETKEIFVGDGSGTIVMTASDKTQFAWEGDKENENEIKNSLFTKYLVEGLKSEADHNENGQITVNELFDYISRKVEEETTKQTPKKFAFDERGDIVLRHGLPRKITMPSAQLVTPDAMGKAKMDLVANRSKRLAKKQIYSFHLTQVPKKLVGIITGDLQNIKEVDVWVNFENTYMEMARPFESSISGMIRYMGAKKDRTDTIREDTIADELSEVVAGRSVPPGVVIYTGAGELAKTNNVKRILHAASLVGMVGMGYSPIERIEDCIRNSLKVLDDPKKLANEKLTSILFPLMGAVQSQQNAENVASDLINEAIAYLEENPSSIVEKVYFLATREQELDLCQRIMKINDRLHPQES